MWQDQLKIKSLFGFRQKIVHRFQAFNKSLKDKQNKYLVCPKCAQIIRVPRNKGKIEVRCPSCRKSFDAKS